MAAQMAMINSPTLTRLIQELQTGFASECQKNLDVQRSEFEQRIQMVEAELVVERKRRIQFQAEALCKALRAQVPSSQHRLDNLGLFLSSVAEFADELKSMVHAMYTVAPSDPAFLYTDVRPGTESPINVPGQSVPSEVASPSSALHTSTNFTTSPANKDQQLASDDDFAPASNLPDPSQPIQVDTTYFDPMVILQTPQSASSTQAPCEPETTPRLQHFSVAETPSSLPLSPSLSSNITEGIPSCPNTTATADQSGAVSLSSAPRFPTSSSHLPISSPFPTHSVPESRQVSTPSSSQSQIQHSASPASQFVSVPSQLSAQVNRTSSQHFITHSSSGTSSAQAGAFRTQDTGGSAQTVGHSPRTLAVVNETVSPVSLPPPAIIESSTASLEKEVIQLLQTKSSSTCCDVKTIPMMYSSRYERDFAKRLIQVGLSTLESFINYFRWQSNIGKSSLMFTERVLDNQTRIFVSVMPLSTKGANSSDVVKQEHRSRPKPTLAGQSPSNSNRADSSEVTPQSPGFNFLHFAPSSPNRHHSKASSYIDENPDLNSRSPERQAVEYSVANAHCEENQHLITRSRSPEHRTVDNSRANSHLSDNQISNSPSHSLERQALNSSSSSYSNKNLIPSSRSHSLERQVVKSHTRRRSDSRSYSPRRDASPSTYRQSRYGSKDRYSRSESRGRSRSSFDDNHAKRSDAIVSRRSLDDIHSFCYYFNKSDHCQRIGTCRYIHACRRCHSFSHGECSCRTSPEVLTSSQSAKSNLNFQITVEYHNQPELDKSS